jgi:putative SOS response-associated peptidase YedK
MKDGRPFAFAGLWERWGQGEDRLESCTILTTKANRIVRPFHDRMPIVLDDYDQWLDPAADPAALQNLLEPYPAEQMTVEPANPYVNNARNEGPECLDSGKPPTTPGHRRKLRKGRPVG